MNKLIQKSDERGAGDFGWLKTKYSFSFSSYYNPKRTGFGALLVLNDDEVAPGAGFGMHPHSNMEIITFVTEGSLEHKDSEGHIGVISQNEVQVMSAGSGVEHSEYNHSKGKAVKLFQIWIQTKEKDIKPRYENKKFTKKDFENKLCTIASGKKAKGELYIHQNASVLIGDFKKGKSFSYKIGKGNGLFAFVISGSIAFEKENLNERDSIELSELNEAEFISKKDSRVLLIEVPMKN